jgi:drug/metabolite transporter (DMT)-like permease
MTADRRRGAIYGLSAALLFGASVPFAKLLLGGTAPLLLAALLYLGAGAALTLVGPLVRRGEARLSRRDLPLLLGITVTGGVIGPICMLLGLSRVSGVAGALLLNLEAPFTMLVAIALFREHLAWKEIAAAALIVAGAATLAARPGELGGSWVGVLLVAAACASWAVDNNLTGRLALKDPIAVVRWKALGAGGGVLVVALATGQALPGAGVAAGALVLGALSYGASIVLDTYALRLLGAAREAAFFATAPFAGALLAVPLLGERPRLADGLAGAAMLAGVALMLRARHAHAHTHDPLDHEHAHVHDEHHDHAHEGAVVEPHSHPHRHDPTTHSHPHVSDAHHRHRH